MPFTNEDGSRLDIDIAFDIDRRILHSRSILTPAYRDVLLKIDDFHCVDFVTYRYVTCRFRYMESDLGADCDTKQSGISDESLCLRNLR